MNENSYIAGVLEALTRGRDELLVGVEEEAIKSNLPDAMKLLVDLAMAAGLGDYLKTEFSFTMTNGVADMFANAQIRTDTISEVRHPLHPRQLQPLKERGDLDHPPSKLYYYFAVSESKLYGRKGNGVDLPEDTTEGGLSVRALRIPKTDFSDLPPQLDDKLIEASVMLIKERGLEQVA